MTRKGAARNGEEFTYALTRYGLERLLVRLAASSHADKFVLKGAMLFRVWWPPVRLRQRASAFDVEACWPRGNSAAARTNGPPKPLGETSTQCGLDFADGGGCDAVAPRVEAIDEAVREPTRA